MLHNFTIKNNKLFIGEISAEDLVAEYGSSLYVYDAEIIKRQYKKLAENITYPKIKFHYACKANTNVALLKLIRQQGAKIETMSKAEVESAFEAGYKSEDISYTCSNISREEIAWLIEKKISVHLDSLTQIRHWGELHPTSNISIRLNQGIGAGHHVTNITGGPESKYGIDLQQLPETITLAKKYNLNIVGLHQHIGSGILDEKIFIKALEKLLETAKQFKNLEFLDFGSGFGIQYKGDQKPLNMASLGKKITKRLTSFMKEYGKEIDVIFEPGRYIVAESGVLLARVLDVKRTPYKVFVGTDSGFNQLIRPTFYDTYQEIVNASNVHGETEVVSVTGNICESADFFAKNREITKFQEGDIVAILDSGAYGYSMSSLYNGRPQPAEVLVEGKKSRLIREQNNLEVVAPKKKLR